MILGFMLCKFGRLNARDRQALPFARKPQPWNVCQAAKASKAVSKAASAAALKAPPSKAALCAVPFPRRWGEAYAPDDGAAMAGLAHLWPRVAGAAPASSVSAVAAGALALPRAGARGGRVSAAHGGSERHRTLR